MYNNRKGCEWNIKYIEVWNSKKQKYEMKEYTRKDWELDKKLNGRMCEFCTKNKATGYTHSGGLKVFHCSKCVRALGHDKINSKMH